MTIHASIVRARTSRLIGSTARSAGQKEGANTYSTDLRRNQFVTPRATRDILPTVMPYIDVHNALKCVQNVEMMVAPEIKIDVLCVMRPHILSCTHRRRHAWSNVVSASLK